MEYAYGRFMKNGEWDKVLDASLVERFVAADVAMVNLETSVSTRGTPQDKTYTFRTAPEDLAYLKEHLGVDVVSLANNHSLDYGVDAFLDTLDHLDEWGIGRVGGGRNIEEAAKPYIAEVQGKTIAIFGASQVAPSHAWYALENRPGQLMAYDTKIIDEAITKAKALYDYVIVFIHWGDERVFEPERLQVQAAHNMIQAGADAIIGSHPHVIQTFEIYQGKPIVYSLGNFLFNNGDGITAVAFLHLTEGEEPRMEIVPCTLAAGSAMKASPERTQTILNTWTQRSKGFGFDAEGCIIPVAYTAPANTSATASPTAAPDPTPVPTITAEPLVPLMPDDITTEPPDTLMPDIPATESPDPLMPDGPAAEPILPIMPEEPAEDLLMPLMPDA